MEGLSEVLRTREAADVKTKRIAKPSIRKKQMKAFQVRAKGK